MHSRDKYKYEDNNGERGDALRKAIENDNIKKLNELLEQNADIKVKINKINALQYAARLGRWQCADLLIKHSKEDSRYYDSSHYMRSAGEVLLLAAKENQTEVVKGIFELINLQRKINNDLVDDGLLYCDVVRPKLRRDDEQGYTSLHWAVHHNNPEMCALFVFFTKIPGAFFKHFGGDAPIYQAKDKDGQTAFELAVSSGYTECAKEIGAGMSYEYLVYHAQKHVLCDTFLADIRLFFTFSGGLDPDRAPSKKDYDKIKKMIFQHILELPVDEKQKAMDLMICKGTALYALFNFGSSSLSEKYINQLADHIHQENNDIKHDFKVMSSTSKLLKRFSSQDNEQYIKLNDNKPQPSIIVKIVDKKEFYKTWMVYEEMGASTSSESYQEPVEQSTNRFSSR